MKKKAAASPWSKFDPAAIPLNGVVCVRAASRPETLVRRNEFNQVLDAASGHLLPFTPEEMKLEPADAAPAGEESPAPAAESAVED